MGLIDSILEDLLLIGGMYRLSLLYSLLTIWIVCLIVQVIFFSKILGSHIYFTSRLIYICSSKNHTDQKRHALIGYF